MSMPTATRTIKLQKLRTPFYVPHHTHGDTDFFGHGPKVKVKVNLRVSEDSARLLANVAMSATETEGDWTKAAGNADFVIFACRPGQTIEAVHSSTAQEVNYTDKDWEEDFVIDGVGERSIVKWSLDDAPSTGLVRFYRFIGDTNGGEAGSKTGVQAFFNPIELTLKGAPIDEIKLGVPTGVGTCGNNTCGSSASTALLNFYGVKIDCPGMRKRIESSANFLNVLRQIGGSGIGIDPGSVRDRMNELSNQFKLRELPNSSVMEVIYEQLESGVPVLALTGIGSKTVRDWYCRSDDCISLDITEGMLHYVVVDGYNRQTDTFHIVDNGVGKYWTSTYLRNAVLWNYENLLIGGPLDAVNVRKGMIIHGKPRTN